MDLTPADGAGQGCRDDKRDGMARLSGWMDERQPATLLPASIALAWATAGRRLVISHDARNVLGTVREHARAAARPSQAGQASDMRRGRAGI
jgi:hypothetical protein